MLKDFFTYHLLPLFFALLLIGLFYSIIPPANKKQNLKIVKDEEIVENGLYANFDLGIKPELALISSIHSKNQITLFGSSELSAKVPLHPYLFLKDSLNINCLAFGRAHHQHLSILCELLTAKEFLENSKIVILISPSWFEQKETNPQAFVEFVRPNFLRKIINDSTIDEKYKLHIGKYIYDHKEYYNEMNKEMIFLMEAYLLKTGKFTLQLRLKHFIQNFHANRFYIENVKYIPATPVPGKSKNWNKNIDSLLHSTQKKFLQSVKNNLYVEQEYYDSYLLDENHKQRVGYIADIDYMNTPELQDFELVLTFLAENKADASFVILPLNPYYYKNLHLQKEFIEHLSQQITNAKFPLLNLFCADTSQYTPGLLKDVMHTGEYGWILINKFIETNYKQKISDENL